MPQGFDLLVFDWDGTLMDSVASIVACMQHAAEDCGLGPASEERVRRMIGLSLVEARSAMGFDVSDELWAQVIDRYRHHWFAGYRDRHEAFPGAEPALAELSRRGYTLAIATGKGRRGLERDLETTGLGRYFVATRTVDEAPSKPHPQMLLELMAELGAAPQRTLMIGDTVYDLEMATNAGAASLAVASGAEAEGELLARGPLACLREVGALPAWLETREFAA
ncbi:MAG: HAD-IA family hydrolase [Thermoanaerobaculia bacterium]